MLTYTGVCSHCWSTRFVNVESMAAGNFQTSLSLDPSLCRPRVLAAWTQAPVLSVVIVRTEMDQSFPFTTAAAAGRAVSAAALPVLQQR